MDPEAEFQTLNPKQEQEQERIELQKRFEEQRRLVLELQEEIGVKAKAIEALEERVALLSGAHTHSLTRARTHVLNLVVQMQTGVCERIFVLSRALKFCPKKRNTKVA